MEAVKVAQNRINALATRWLNAYPAAVRCLLKHRESLTVHLRFPRKHRNRVRRPNSMHLRRNPPPG
ncbi:MAG TPA: hypothetical protein VEF72_11480 [Mycobacterium sp.]|nr:hypothetical protein [Mycobacterium sp.]